MSRWKQVETFQKIFPWTAPSPNYFKSFPISRTANCLGGEAMLWPVAIVGQNNEYWTKLCHNRIDS